MASAKISISLSEELEAALARLATRRATERSPLIELLLREHPLVRAEIDSLRAYPEPKTGRSIDELAALGRRLESGRFKIHDSGDKK